MVLEHLGRYEMAQPIPQNMTRPREPPTADEVFDEMVPNRCYVAADLRVEFEDEYDPAHNTIRNRLAEIGDDLDYSANHVGMRCRELDDYGLLENLGGGTYAITGLGEQFLDGEFDAGDIESND